MQIWQRINNIALFKKHPSLAQFVKFSLVGVSGTIIDFGIYTLLTRALSMFYVYATGISVFLAIINNFFLNKHWTFRRGQSGIAKVEYGKFFTVSVANYLVNLGITYYIVEFTSADDIFGNYDDYFAKVIAIVVILFSNFFANKYWTFRK